MQNLGTGGVVFATMVVMRFRWVVVVLGFAVLGLAACGGEPELVLTPAAAEGREIANASGCASCHGKNGQGITAPSWQGLYLEPVPLAGGSTVVADEEYLHRSITDPQAEVVRDWTIKMPTNSLSDDEIDAIITYIKELQ